MRVSANIVDTCLVLLLYCSMVVGKRRELNTEDPNLTLADDTPDPSDRILRDILEPYIALIVKTCSEHLSNIKSNIKRFYKEVKQDSRVISEVFDYNANEYATVLRYSLKTIAEKEPDNFNSTHEFLLHIADLASTLMTEMIAQNIETIRSKPNVSRAWSDLTFVEKIHRQQEKSSRTILETSLCEHMHVCAKTPLNYTYTDYLRKWLRYLLNTDDDALRQVFDLFPACLERNKHTLKTNVEFRHFVSVLVNDDVGDQRDLIDLIDEIITEDFFEAIEPELPLYKTAFYFKTMIVLLDVNYNMNPENINQLEVITKKIEDFMNGENVKIALVLENIIQNMVANFLIFTFEVRRRIDSMWTKISMPCYDCALAAKHREANS